MKDSVSKSKIRIKKNYNILIKSNIFKKIMNKSSLLWVIIVLASFFIGYLIKYKIDNFKIPFLLFAIIIILIVVLNILSYIIPIKYELLFKSIEIIFIILGFAGLMVQIYQQDTLLNQTQIQIEDLREQFILEDRPFIDIRYDIEGQDLSLTLKNVGNYPAEIDEYYIAYKDQNESLTSNVYSINTLFPNEESKSLMKYNLCDGQDYFEIIVYYHSTKSKEYKFHTTKEFFCENNLIIYDETFAD